MQARRLRYFESNQPAFERALEDGLASFLQAFPPDPGKGYRTAYTHLQHPDSRNQL
jgi:hypothetical protein